MNKSKKLLGKLAKSTALHMLKREANNTSCLAVFQPAVPSKLALLKDKKHVL